MDMKLKQLKYRVLTTIGAGSLALALATTAAPAWTLDGGSRAEQIASSGIGHVTSRPGATRPGGHTRPDPTGGGSGGISQPGS